MGREQCLEEKLYKNKITSTSQQKSKIHSDISHTMTKIGITPPHQYIQAPQIPQMLPNEQIEEDNPLQFVKIGDIVCIQYFELVFDSLREYAKLDGGRDNLSLAKILEKPDYEYKGIIFSDGIINKEIKLGSEKNEETIANRNKAIFRIEVIQEYKLSQQFHALEVEMAALNQTDFENPEEENEKHLIYNDIKKKFLKEK